MLRPVDEEVEAGEFGAWLEATVASLRGGAAVEVPCGSCVGCCVSAYFIPLRPGDRGARARIPAQVLVDAPDQPPGHAMMGHGADGHCPMLAAGRCTIYPDRPQTCRDYDCRIFAAAGIEAGGPQRRVINQRVRAWRFSHAHADLQRVHDAIRLAAAFIRDRWQAFPGHCAPTAPTGIAVLALKAYPVFLDGGAAAGLDDAGRARAIIQASRDFDQGSGLGPGLPGLLASTDPPSPA